jgi:hypothetical protein
MSKNRKHRVNNIKTSLLEKVLSKIIKQNGYEVNELRIVKIDSPIDVKYQIMNSFNPNPPKIQIFTGLEKELKKNLSVLIRNVFLNFILTSMDEEDVNLKDLYFVVYVDYFP